MAISVHIRLLFMVIAGLTTTLSGIGQSYNLRIKVMVENAIKPDSIYLAGNFNEWNPADTNFLLIKKGAYYSISIPGLKENIYQYKITAGDWSRVEVDSNGNSIDNRLLNLTSDTSIAVTVRAWQEQFKAKEHTASANVSILDTAFYIPQLDRYRKIWIYLPAGYHTAKPKTRYPVIYMHDGQNLFDDHAAPFGEWSVDECLDSMIRQGSLPSIVVGIECGPKRLTEYNPYYYADFGKGEGKEYVNFIVETLKPYVDKNYKTFSKKEFTTIAGSSLGGLISYYAMLTHPKVFGNAGIFSPSFWIANEIKQLTDSIGQKVKGKMFFYIGGAEGERYITDMTELADKMGSESDAVIYSLIDPASRHNESAWRKWFPEFYKWITASGFNSPIKLDDTRK